ncbi:hypothetical protein [Hyphomicrobium sp.]|uniref:hypothetical protein n=1 Tax=Hyphomicrobium sp. TaxID=82 RepID=UPI0025BC4185|nr:hypothetical protein [Hyphomicrobium sp.]
MSRLAFAAALTLCVLDPDSLAAADLGGSCCADLEERIAELEATTARKGNRKVSLTVTGYVTKQIMFWDDGVEHNAYIQDIGPTQATNFRFTGEATIAPGWKAGYLMRIQDLHDNPMGANQNTPSGDQGLNLQMSHWYIASKEFGKLAVGKNALASKSAAMFTDLSGTQVIANYVLFDGGVLPAQQRCPRSRQRQMGRSRLLLFAAAAVGRRLRRHRHERGALRQPHLRRLLHLGELRRG